MAIIWRRLQVAPVNRYIVQTWRHQLWELGSKHRQLSAARPMGLSCDGIGITTPQHMIKIPEFLRGNARVRKQLLVAENLDSHSFIQHVKKEQLAATRARCLNSSYELTLAFAKSALAHSHTIYHYWFVHSLLWRDSIVFFPEFFTSDRLWVDAQSRI